MRKFYRMKKTSPLSKVFDKLLCSQTTSVTRIGGPGGLLKVRVEIDRLGDLKLKISNLFNGKKLIG